MADVFTAEKRSDIMSRIKGKNTGLEAGVFTYLRCRGVYFQKHYARVPGKPDIALPRKRRAVFIDSDFWHGWKFEERSHKLPPFWQKKIGANIKRDRRTRRTLRDAGWRVLRVWEHDLKRDPVGTLSKIEDFLSAPENDLR